MLSPGSKNWLHKECASCLQTMSLPVISCLICLAIKKVWGGKFQALWFTKLLMVGLHVLNILAPQPPSRVCFLFTLLQNSPSIPLQNKLPTKSKFSDLVPFKFLFIFYVSLYLTLEKDHSVCLSFSLTSFQVAANCLISSFLTVKCIPLYICSIVSIFSFLFLNSLVVSRAQESKCLF